MICPYCHQQHPDTLRYCPVTGGKLEQLAPSCPGCRNQVPPGVQFCPFCGVSLAVPAMQTLVRPVGGPIQQSAPPHRWKWAIFAIAALLILSAAAVGVYWLVYQPAQEPGGNSGQQSESGDQASIAIVSLSPTAIEGITLETPVETTAVDLLLPQISSTDIADVGTTTPGATPSPSQPPTPTPLPTATLLPTPTSIAEAGLIAFNSNRAGNNDIYVMYADGSGITQLTSSSTDDRIPSWSPDGREIAYQSNNGGDYEITIYDLENGGIRQVTNNSCDDYNPVFSPDGEWFVFYSDCDGNREIYKIRVDGSDRRQLTQTNQVYNWFPNWSPDGQQITFSSNRSGKYEVFVMDANGSAARALARWLRLSILAEW